MVKVNKSASKKPTPKVAKGNKVSAKKGGKAKAPKNEYELGQEVQFVGYGEDTPEDEQIFEPGDRLIIKDISEETGEDGKVTKLYTAVAKDSSDAYDENPDDDDIVGGEVIASEIKKVSARAAKAEAEPIKVTNVGDMAKLTKKGDLVDTAKGLLEEAKKNFFYFGGVMAKIYNENIDAPEGVTWIKNREAWEEFTLENFDMRPGQVRAYVDIYLTISAIPNIDVKRIAAMGWSKAAEISKYITSDNADEIVSLAEDKPIQELKTELKDTYVDAEGKTPSGRSTRSSSKIAKTQFSFALYEDSAATVKYILETAKKTLGLDSDEQVFEHIVNEWGADHLDANKVSNAKKAGNKARADLKKRGIELPSNDNAEPAKKSGKKVKARA